MGEAAIGWLLLGVVLHLANQVMRGRGWCAIVRAASDADCGPRRRDAIAAWVAGAGAGGLVSARGGDALRVLLLKRRMPETGCPLLAASFAPVTGTAVSTERIAAFTVGTSTVLTIVGTALALAVCLRDQTLPRQGLSGLAALVAAGRRLIARAATAPTQ